MEKYCIKNQEKDFKLSELNYNTKGSRTKKIVVDNDDNKAFFKYQAKNYLVSEACSEKMCYEIAKILDYKCARIELAKDSSGTLGVLNYWFIDSTKSNDRVEHIDAVSYLSIHYRKRNEFYTISNIKETLDALDKKLFSDFIKIMVFDALVGEQDRHEENWGIERDKNGYKISPLYDNGCSLLKEFKDFRLAEQYYTKQKDFDAYIKRSKTYIYKEDNATRYKHFELIEYLNEKYHDDVQKEINNLNKLTNELISDLVNKIPDELLTKIHKEYIICYLKKRRDILLKIN